MSVIQASFEPSVARETIDVGDTVTDALDVMARTGQAVRIVTCEGLPIGIVTARGLCSERAGVSRAMRVASMTCSRRSSFRSTAAPTF